MSIHVTSKAGRPFRQKLECTAEGVFRPNLDSLIENGYLVLYCCADKGVKGRDLEKLISKRGVAIVRYNQRLYLVAHRFKPVPKGVSLLNKERNCELLRCICKDKPQEVARVVKSLFEYLLLETLRHIESKARWTRVRLLNNDRLVVEVNGRVRARFYIRWLRGAEGVYILNFKVRRKGLSHDEYQRVCRRTYKLVWSEFLRVIKKHGLVVKTFTTSTFEEETSFSTQDISYLFGRNARGTGPLALLFYGPYGIRRQVTSVAVPYYDEDAKRRFKQMLVSVAREFNMKVRERDGTLNLTFSNQSYLMTFKFIRISTPVGTRFDKVKRLIEKLKAKYVILLLLKERMGDEIFGELKWKSVYEFADGRRLSRLQVLNTLDSQEPKLLVGNIISSLIFKDGGVPWFVNIHQEVNRELESSLIIGVAFSRVSRGYVRGVAMMMRGDGTLICSLDRDFRVESSMEFSESEIKRFAEDVKTYIDRLDFDPNKIVVIRSRIYEEREVRSILKAFDRALFRGLLGLRRRNKKVLLVSISTEVHVPNAQYRKADYIVRLGDSAFLYYYREWLHPLCIRYHSNVDISLGEVLTIVEALRRYNFSTVSKSHKRLAPFSYALKMARWARGLT